MNRLGACLLLALTAAPAWGQEASDLAPDSVPTPVARPGGESGIGSASPEAEPSSEQTDGKAGDPEGGQGTDQASEGRPDLIPPEAMPPVAEEPPAGELEEGAAAPEEPAQPSARDAASPPADVPAEPPLREVLTETPEELSTCLAALDGLGVAYERAEPVTEPDNADCGIANPLTVSALAPGVALEPPSAMRCATALAGARWVADVVVPLSQRLERGDLVAIDQGTAYLCRPRADGAMSEHAWGNALDVMGFRFSDGEPLPVEVRAGDGTLEEAFQRAVRAGACLDFATVLGPGSDADHADHLHFDIKARDGGFRICE